MPAIHSQVAPARSQLLHISKGRQSPTAQHICFQHFALQASSSAPRCSDPGPYRTSGAFRVEKFHEPASGQRTRVRQANLEIDHAGEIWVPPVFLFTNCLMAHESILSKSQMQLVIMVPTVGSFKMGVSSSPRWLREHKKTILRAF